MFTVQEVETLSSALQVHLLADHNEMPFRRDEVCMGPGKRWMRSGGLVSEGKGCFRRELCRHSNLGLCVSEGS